MADRLERLAQYQEAILLGEIGALLHMFGKCSSEFIASQSLDRDENARDSHQDLKHLPQLAQQLKKRALAEGFALPPGALIKAHAGNGDGTDDDANLRLVGDFTDFITKYTVRRADCALMKLFSTCHRMTSADEKGVVRAKQPQDDTWIATPFGYRERKINLGQIDDIRVELDQDLSSAFQAYLSAAEGIEWLRDRVVEILKPGFSLALGETRRPANDITLWAQSHGVASLYKPVLATLALGLNPAPPKNADEFDSNALRWRLFGVGWNGLRFLRRGRRAADILRRQDILRDIAANIRQELEVTHPVGNRFYSDLNGVFFTFPGIDDPEAEALVEQLAPGIAEMVRERSASELWPFFTLSQPSRTLTLITGEVRARDGLASLPQTAAIVSLDMGNGNRSERLLIPGPDLTAPRGGREICPICQSRSKPLVDEICGVCRDRRSGHQRRWREDPSGRTIWVDELADRNNRIVLLTLRFDLSGWLSGEWLSTIQSQTTTDWLLSERMAKVLTHKGHRRNLEQHILPDLPQAVRAVFEPEGADASFDDAVPELVGAAVQSLQHISDGNIRSNTGFKVALLNTFFERDIRSTANPEDDYYIERFLANLRQRISDDPAYSMTAEDLASAIFTLNPSPGRLARIQEEAQQFVDAWIEAAAHEHLGAPARLRFTTATPVSGIETGGTYRVAVPGLEPEDLVVLCLNESGQDFVTVESLDKFTLGDRKVAGAAAVRQALIRAGARSWRVDGTGEAVQGAAGPIEVRRDAFHEETYRPLIVLANSPAFCQVLLPTGCVPEALQRLVELFDRRLENVRGKLPLHIGILVANRRFPLYQLIEAGQRVLDDPALGQGIAHPAWWPARQTAAQRHGDPYFSLYPTSPPGSGRYPFTKLASASAGTRFHLTPGYADFDFLGSTADRHRLTYEANGSVGVRRSGMEGWPAMRPFPLHRLRSYFEIWTLLAKRGGGHEPLTPTQIHHLREALESKLTEWRAVEPGEMAPVFDSFARATLRRAYGKGWEELQQNERNLLETAAWDGRLLDTIELFQHVLKEG